MKQIKALVALFLLLASFGASQAQSDPKQNDEVDAAIKAIEGCMHWVGEAGEGDEDRSKQIAEMSDKYCTVAQQKSEHAYKLYPKDARLAAYILKLIDILYFDASYKEKLKICNIASVYFQNGVKPDEDLYGYNTYCPPEKY